MRLHSLQSGVIRKKKKRVGRGGKRGTFSGHGNKGQRSRAGHRIRPAERDLISRLPKLRGVKHKRISPPARVLNIRDINRFFKDEKEITRKLLVDRGMISNVKERVKLLGNGVIKRAVTIRGIQVSESAKKKIEAVGGSVNV